MSTTYVTMDVDIDSLWGNSCYLDRLFIGLILTVGTDKVTEDSFDDVFEENILHKVA